MSTTASKYQVFAVEVNSIRKFGIRDSETGAQVGELTNFNCRATQKACELNRAISSGLGVKVEARP